jgi:hypothetical protein
MWLTVAAAGRAIGRSKLRGAALATRRRPECGCEEARLALATSCATGKAQELAWRACCATGGCWCVGKRPCFTLAASRASASIGKRAGFARAANRLAGSALESAFYTDGAKRGARGGAMPSSLTVKTLFAPIHIRILAGRARRASTLSCTGLVRSHLAALAPQAARDWRNIALGTEVAFLLSRDFAELARRAQAARL